MEHMLLYGAHLAFIDERHKYVKYNDPNASATEICFSRFIDGGNQLCKDICKDASHYMLKWVAKDFVKTLTSMYDARINGLCVPIEQASLAAVAAGFLAYCNTMDIKYITSWLNGDNAGPLGLHEYAEKIQMYRSVIHHSIAMAFIDARRIIKMKFTKRLEIRQVIRSKTSNLTAREIQILSDKPSMNLRDKVHFWMTTDEDVEDFFFTYN